MATTRGSVTMPAEVEVTGLYVYPVKSMKAVAMNSSAMGFQGLSDDRRWMAVFESGKFVTQRQLARLTLIQPQLNELSLTLSAEGYESFTLPFNNPAGDIIESDVWGEKVLTRNEGGEASAWLTEVLQSEESVKLVRMAEGYVRPQSHPQELGADTSTLFADAAPFLVGNESSLAALNDHLDGLGEKTVPMDRFRPNIVLRGLDAFSEHRIAALSNGDSTIQMRFSCERCVVTTIDQNTALRHPSGQPFKALRSLNPVAQDNDKPAFGQNATLDSTRTGRISVGDLFTVVT
jgi:uncharacterized protein YcbX